MTVFVLCMLSADILGEKVYLSLKLLWNCIFCLFVFVFLYKISPTVFKCIHGNAPDYLKDLIVLSQPQTGLRTANRANRLAPLPFPKYCKVLVAFRYSAPTVWNNLPPSI